MRRAHVSGTLVLGLCALAWASAGPASVPSVLALRPDAEVVPENLLRLYLDFSRPMAGGDVLERIVLLDERGRPIADAFRDVELWSRDGTRLTLYVHPGRVKRGIAFGAALGPVLENGRSYSLLVGPGMASRDGRRVEHERRFTLRVGPPVRTAIEQETLEVSVESGRVLVRGDRLWDQVALERFVRVDGERVTATTSGTVASIVPARPLGPGEHRLVVESELEDPCGNSFFRAFETRPGDASGRLEPVAVTFRSS